MSERKNLLFAVIIAVIIFAAALALVAHGENKPPEAVTAETIGYIDFGQMQEKFPDFARLKDLKAAYETELNTFAQFQRQSLASYLEELERKKDDESAGKTEAEKAEIGRKYEKLAQDKATEINQSVQDKSRELQAKFNAELAKADERLRQTIVSVGTDKGLNLILAKSAVYFGGLDLTNDVINKATQAAKK